MREIEAEIEEMVKAFNSALNIDITDKSRKTLYNYARMIFCYYCYNLITTDRVQIGKALGGRDRNTVLHLKRRFKVFVGYEDFKLIHNACVKEINSLGLWDRVELLEVKNKGIVTKEKIEAHRKSMNDLKNRLVDVFLSDDIIEDTMKLTESELIELRDCKIVPHLRMLKSKRYV